VGERLSEKKETFGCYNSLLMSDLMNHKAIWSNYMRIDILQLAQIPLVASRHDMTRTTCRECRDERVAPCLFQHGGRRRNSSARTYKFSLLCSGFASISGTTSEKKWGGHVHPNPRCGDAPEHVSYESRLSWRACRAMLSDKRYTARHDCFLCQNSWAR